MDPTIVRRAAALVAVIAALSFVQSASADDYCVNTACGGQNMASLQDALDKAATWDNTDRIFVGPGVYMAPAGGFHYQPWKSPVEIRGAGVGKTILTAAQGASGRVLMAVGGGAGIYDLTVTIPTGVVSGFVGIETDAWIDGVKVDEAGAQTQQRMGVLLHNYGQLRDSTVTLADDGTNSSGVVVFSGTTTVWGSTISAQTAVSTRDDTTVGNSRLFARVGVAVNTGKADVTHTLIVGSGWYWTGLAIGNQSTGDTVVNADGLVITGSGYGQTRGIDAGTLLNPGRSIQATIKNSVIRGATQSLFAYAMGPATANIDISYSDYDPSGDETQGAYAHITESHVTNLGASAGFVDEAARDFHLAPGSPLIDAGDPSSPVAYFDLDGNPLDTDGDGDGIARCDVGAFEAPTMPLKPQPGPPSDPPASDPPASGTGDLPAPIPPGAADTQPPVLTGLAVSARAFAVGRAVTALSARVAHGTRFRFKVSESARVVVRIERALGHKRWRGVGTLTRAARPGPNSIRFSGRLGRRALSPGRYRALVRAADAAGNRSAAKQVRFAVLRRPSSR